MERQGLVGLLSYIRDSAIGLQNDFPQIGEEWLSDSGATYESLAKKYDIVNHFGISSSDPSHIAASIVGVAIRGMPDTNCFDGFEGLVSKEEREDVSRRKTLMGFYNYLQSGSLNVFSAENARVASHKGVCAKKDYRGLPRTLISEGEEKFAYELSLASKNNRGTSWEDVASGVNKKFYDGENVRSSKSVRMMVYRFKKSLNGN